MRFLEFFLRKIRFPERLVEETQVLMNLEEVRIEPVCSGQMRIRRWSVVAFQVDMSEQRVPEGVLRFP